MNFSSITTAIKNTSVSNILVKTAGIGALGLVAYDSHNAGKIEAGAYQKTVKSKSLAQNAIDDLTLSDPSIVKQKVKGKIFQFNLDENLSGFFTSIAGYIKGFASMTVSNVIPMGLALGTVLSPSKTLLSKTFGVGLLAYGAVFLAQEVLGIGKEH